MAGETLGTGTIPAMAEHFWSGFPGAYCLKCGQSCAAEECMAQNFPECQEAVDAEGWPDPQKCPIHGTGTPCPIEGEPKR